MAGDERRARRVDALAALVVLAVAAGFVVAARREPPAFYDPLGPGTAPTVLALALGALGLVLLARALLGLAIGRGAQSLITGLDGAAPADYPLRPGLAAFALAATAAYVAALHARLPFLWATMAFLAILGGAMGGPRPRRLALAGIVAVVGAVAIDVLFRRLLLVNLP
jgi:hypothetical protein